MKLKVQFKCQHITGEEITAILSVTGATNVDILLK